LKRVLGLIVALAISGCAAHPVVKTNVIETPAPTWQLVQGTGYTYSVPESFKNVKKDTDKLIDTVYASRDGFLVVSTAIDKSDDTLPIYAENMAAAMVFNGAELLDHSTGQIGGMSAVLLLLGVDKRFLSFDILAKDKKDNVYIFACALNPLLIKQNVPVCMDIARTFLLSSGDHKAMETESPGQVGHTSE
jgi:hypothetical protein